VQYVKWKGAIAVGTALSAHVEVIKKLDVDQAIDYKTEQFEETVTNLDVVSLTAVSIQFWLKPIAPVL
jgi:NADPH-dependent curcumin reductase CurA